jgi:hypothetical protein
MLTEKEISAVKVLVDYFEAKFEYDKKVWENFGEICIDEMWRELVLRSLERARVQAKEESGFN